MTRPLPITLSIAGVVLVAVTWMIATVFTSHKYELQDLNTQLRYKDTLRAYEVRAREAQKAHYDTLIAHLMSDAKDATTKARSNKTYYETAKQQIRQVDIDVSAYSDTALLRAYAEFR